MLLLGKTGSGKSATANSIVGYKAFTSKSATMSVTKSVKQAFTDRGKYNIKIVDGPGTGDTRLNKEKAVQQATEDFTKAIEKCTEGFHALVMVYKFGNRFTQEDQDSVDFLKKMFGYDVFNKFGICVITCGDQFRGTMEDDDTPDMTITEWCQKQDEDSKDELAKFSSLLSECENRIVLFDNRTKEEKVKHAQIEELVNVVRKLPTNGELYKSKQFEAMAKERKRLILEYKLPQFQDEIQQKCGLLQEALHKIDLSTPEASAKMIDLKYKAKDIIKEIKDTDDNTGVLLPLKANVEKVMSTICKYEEIQQKETQQREKQKQNADEFKRMQQNYEQQMNGLRMEMKEKEKQNLSELELAKAKQEHEMKVIQMNMAKEQKEREQREQQKRDEMERRRMQENHELELRKIQKEIEKQKSDINKNVGEMEKEAGFFDTIKSYVVAPFQWAKSKIGW